MKSPWARTEQNETLPYKEPVVFCFVAVFPRLTSMKLWESSVCCRQKVRVWKTSLSLTSSFCSPCFSRLRYSHCCPPFSPSSSLCVSRSPPSASAWSFWGASRWSPRYRRRTGRPLRARERQVAPVAPSLSYLQEDSAVSLFDATVPTLTLPGASLFRFSLFVWASIFTNSKYSMFLVKYQKQVPEFPICINEKSESRFLIGTCFSRAQTTRMERAETLSTEEKNTL